MSAWNTVKNNLQNVPELTVIGVDGNDPNNDVLSFYYKVQKFPTIILTTPNNNIEYVG